MNLPVYDKTHGFQFWLCHWDNCLVFLDEWWAALPVPATGPREYVVLCVSSTAIVSTTVLGITAHKCVAWRYFGWQLHRYLRVDK